MEMGDDDNTQYWQIAAGDSEKRDYSDIFLKYGVMCVGPGDPGEYSKNKRYYQENKNFIVRFVEKVKTFDKDATRYYDLTFKDDVYRAVRNNSRDRYKYADNEVVGNLEDLYNKYSESDFEDMGFFKNQLTRGKVADKKG